MVSLAHQGDPDLPYFIEIHSPWDPDDYVAVNYPEHFATSQGMLMHHRSDIETPYRQTKPVQWEIGEDGRRAGYTCEFENGLVFSVELCSTDREVTQSIRLRNGSDRPLTHLRPTLCARLDGWREFGNADNKPAHLDRTYALIDGKLTAMSQVWASIPQERKQIGEGRVWPGCNVRGQRYQNDNWYIADHECDAGFIAVRSKERERYVAIFWPKCRLVFTNTNCPCIHADPELPDCAVGEEVSLSGEVIFHEGSLQSLVERLGLQ